MDPGTRNLVVALGLIALSGCTGAGRSASPPAGAGSADVPPVVAQEVHGLLAALEAKDWAQVRAHLSDEFLWTFGPGEPTGDEAVRQLRSSDELRDALVRVLKAGCVTSEGGTAVVCPPNAEAESYFDYRVRFEKRAGWKMTSFVAGD